MHTSLNSERSPSYSLKAVIDVGSTSIRMALGQVYENSTFRLLDSLSQSISIGSDTFNLGMISHYTTEKCVEVLANFRQVLEEYRMDPERDVRAVATSAVSEASNRNDFLDRIYMATGINVEVIEGSEVNRLTFLALEPLISENPRLREGRLLAAEVGGGSTVILGIEDGRVFYTHSYRIGSYRLREIIGSMNVSESRQIEALEIEIESGMRLLGRSAGKRSGRVNLLLMGGDIRFAARQLLPEWDGSSLVELTLKKLEKFAETIIHSEVEKIAGRYGLPLEEAGTLGPALRIYCRMADKLSLKKALVCGVTLRDGLMAEAASGSGWTDEFVEQILHSARKTGKKYYYDADHADCVTENSIILFNALQSEHRLQRKERVILKVASILHDTGVFIDSQSHHKHSRYIIQNSEIFGLGSGDILVASLVARYHRRSMPKESHEDYMSLPRELRMTVSKLAALLRVADALDRSHMQTIRDPDIVPRQEAVYIIPENQGNHTAARRAVEKKGDLFTKVFGRPAVLLDGRSAFQWEDMTETGI